jgi:biotin carboxylase
VFRRSAVVNRGEPAMRLIRAARELDASTAPGPVAEGRDQLGLVTAVQRGMKRATQS